MTGRKDTYAVERIPPSERVRKEIDELLNGKTPTKCGLPFGIDPLVPLKTDPPP
jgi:hypothetical protein